MNTNESMPSSSPRQVVNHYRSSNVIPVGHSGDAPELLTRRMVRLLIRNWWILVLGTVIFGGCFVSYYSFMTPKFCAEGLIEMSVRRPRIMNQKAAITDDTDINTMLQMQVSEIFNTRIEKLKGKKIRELTTGRIKSQLPQSVPQQETIDTILDSIKVNLIRRTSLIKISYKDENPVFACQVVNAFADSVVQLSQEENRADSDNAVAWLEQQAVKQGQTVGKIRQTTMNLRETNHWDMLTNEWSALQAALNDTSKQLTQLENTQILANEILRSVRQVKSNPQGAGNLPDSTPRREELMACVSKWMAALQERDGLLAKYTSEHPSVVAATKTIEMHKTLVSTAIDRAQSTAEANLLLQQQQVDGLRKQRGRLAENIAEMDRKLIRLQTEISPFERELVAAEMCYTGLLTRIEEARLSADENTAVVKIIERATPPDKPHNPYKLLVLVFGVFLGLAGGLGIAVLVEITEDRFVGTEDLERTLGLRVIGVVPRLSKKARAEIGQLCGTDRNGHMAEAYAGIRAVISAVMSKRQTACLLVTSASPSEGKTVTATNLAIAFAQSRFKTLLVDFDLRRPQVQSVFSMPKGDNHFLEILDLGAVDSFYKLPLATQYPNLSVISNYASRKYCVAEIIGRPIIRQFITWARAQYEMIVIDSPPIGVVSDSLVLATIVDGVLLVHRPGISRRHALRGAVQQFNDVNAPLMGVVVNGVVLSRFFALSNYDYRYGGGDYTYDYPAERKLH